MTFEQWFAVVSLGVGIAAQIGLSIKIDLRLGRIERKMIAQDVEISRVDTKLEERTNPRQLRVVEDA